MREAGVPSTGECAFHGVRDPPGVVMLSPLTILRNASMAQCEGRSGSGVRKARPSQAV